MARRQISKPRFYCDIFSYLKSIGKYNGTNTSGIDDPENKEKVFTMNPYQPYGFNLDDSGHESRFRFWINQEPTTTLQHIPEHELGKLLAYHNPVGTDGEHHSSGWYAGILGHNLATLGASAIHQRFFGMHNDNSLKYSDQSQFREIINFESGTLIENAGNGGKPKHDGFSLWEITEKNTENFESRFSVAEFTFEKNDGSVVVNWGDNNFLKIGAVTTGIFFEPEHAFELSATVSYSQEGIKRQTTVGGSTITNTNYLGVPNWGNQPAWTLQKTDARNYSAVTNRARRQWEVGLSFIADDNMFDKAGNANKFVNDSFTDGVEDAYQITDFDTSLSSMFKLTHMGSLPFIFCPDSQADDLEFALCRITNKPSFKQVANNLFSTSLVITETW